MIGYTKLFGTILDSSIWVESKETKILWITMLAMAGKEGVVEAAIPGLAKRANLSLAETENALRSLLEPDKYSRTKEHDGRRVQEVDGGWLILNHDKYRRKMSADERREYLRVKQQEHRMRTKLPNDGNGTPLARTDGFVYYAVDGNRIKIGFSANPWARVWEFRTTIPSVELYRIEKGTMATEKERHKQFSALRIDREWFKFEGELKIFVGGLDVNTLSTMSTERICSSTPSTHSEATSASSPEASKSSIAKSAKAQGEDEFIEWCIEALGATTMKNWGGRWRNFYRDNPSKAKRAIAATVADMKEKPIENLGGYAADLFGRFV